MRHGTCWLTLVLAGAILSCGDPFSVQDVLGDWQTASINGTDLPGMADIYIDGDTLVQNVASEYWTFSTGGVCQESSVVNGFPDTIDDCEYLVDEEAEELAITLLSTIFLSGPVEGNRITLRYRVSAEAPENTLVLLPRPTVSPANSR